LIIIIDVLRDRFRPFRPAAENEQCRREFVSDDNLMAISNARREIDIRGHPSAADQSAPRIVEFDQSRTKPSKAGLAPTMFEMSRMAATRNRAIAAVSS
jgi:hypothetical protein